MISRRFLFSAGAATVLGGWAGLASASTDELLSDILRGVADAVTREYIRDHYREGRWDGRHWWRDGRRFTVDEYRVYLTAQARPNGPRPPQGGPRPNDPRPGRPDGEHGGPGGPGGRPEPGGRPGRGDRPDHDGRPGPGGQGGPGGPGGRPDNDERGPGGPRPR